MKVIILSVLLSIGTETDPVAPDTLTLGYCYERLEEHYPLARKSELQQLITNLQVQLANTGYYPKLEFGGKASYQSEVTRLFSEAGGFKDPSLSKDQYQIFIDVNQPIYNGGITGIQKKLERERGHQDQLSTKIQMQEVRTQVDVLYFSILMARQQAKTIQLLIENLTTQVELAEKQVQNGLVLPSQQHVLQAELIKTRQDFAETQSTIDAGIEVLGVLIGESIPRTAAFELPGLQYTMVISDEVEAERAEMEMFESSMDVLNHQIELVSAQKMPSVSLYGSLAYGRPGYNFFENKFHEFYMVGARIRWSFWDWRNSQKEQRVLKLQQEKVASDREAFNKQLRASLSRIENRIELMQEQLKADKEIIELRKKIVAESESQLRNGVITATEYVMELNSENQAKLAMFARKVRLAQLQVRYATTKGILPTQLNKLSTGRER